MTTKVYFEQDDDIVEICKDNVFKAVFSKDIPASRIALSRLVSAFIGRDVTIIDILSNEPPIENTRDRQVSFDINCRAENGELVNVEMCFHPHPFEPVRLEFHVGKLFIGQDIRGKDRNFNDLKRAYQIAILAKERFFPDELLCHTFEYYDPENKVSLNGKTRIVTLELSKVAKIIEKPTDEMNIQELWAVFFRYLTDKSKRDKINEIAQREEGIAKAGEVVMSISQDERERARIMWEEKNALDLQNYVVTAKREGRAEGLAEGELKIVDLLKSGKSPEEIISMYESSKSGSRL